MLETQLHLKRDQRNTKGRYFSIDFVFCCWTNKQTEKYIFSIFVLIATSYSEIRTLIGKGRYLDSERCPLQSLKIDDEDDPKWSGNLLKRIGVRVSVTSVCNLGFIHSKPRPHLHALTKAAQPPSTDSLQSATGGIWNTNQAT